MLQGRTRAGAGWFPLQMLGRCFKFEAGCRERDIQDARHPLPNLIYGAGVPAPLRKMRMKFNKSGQLLLVSACSLLVAGILTACSTNTVDFVYVTSSLAAGANSYGEIDVFEVNVESGYMRQIPTSPFPSGGRNPVADAVSTDFQNLYVVNKDDNTIVQFVIGIDGKLYPQNTTNTPGIFPTAVAASASNLFVLDTYQPLTTCSTASPCSGSVAVYPILAASGSSGASGSIVDGTLQANTPINACNGLDYVPLTLPGSASGDIVQPTALNIPGSTGNAGLMIAAYDVTANAGYIYGFSIGTMSCPNNPAPYQTIPTLTPLTGSPFAAGIQPSGIASDPTGSFVYVTDKTAGTVLGYAVQSGTLTPLTNGAGGGNSFAAGAQPSALVVDTNGKFMYVTNFLDANVTAYSINAGALTKIDSYATGLQPVALGIDPSHNHYLYTINFLGNSVSGFQVNPTDGSLINTQSSPYRANSLPTAVAAIPHNTPTAK